MKKLDFNENFKEYMCNGDESRIIRVKLDPEMLEKLDKSMPEIDGLKELLGDDPTPYDIAEAGRKFAEIVNDVFCTDICTPAFGSSNPFSVVESGKYLFESFFDVFIPAFREDMEEFRIRPEVQKYLKES